MKLKLFFYALFLSLSIQPASAAYVQITKISCTKISAKLMDADPICYGCRESFCNPFIIPNYLKLQKKVGNAWQTISIKPGHHHTFSLVANKTYRVVASLGKSSGFITNICGYYGQTVTQEIGIQHKVTSPNYYTGIPVASGFIQESFGAANNGCLPYAYGEPVWLNAFGCTGELDYQVQLTREDGTWNSNGWQTGTAGLIDLREVWRTNTNWELWPDTYTLNLAVRNGCSPWRSINITLEIFDPSGSTPMPCRTGNFESAPISVNLFPNPASYEITLEGVEEMEGDVEYFIQDFSGKLVSKGRITNPTMPIGVSDLVNGMYVINIASDNNIVTKKFTIVK